MSAVIELSLRIPHNLCGHAIPEYAVHKDRRIRVGFTLDR